VEIVHRFEKQRTLTFEQLRDEVFGQHWQDETWHEVLKLICGAIDPRFAGELIEFLAERKLERSEFIDPVALKMVNRRLLTKAGLIHLVLATDCLTEIKSQQNIDKAMNKLLESLKEEILILETDIPLGINAAIFACNAIAKHFRNDPSILLWLKERIQPDNVWEVRQAAVEAIAAQFKANFQILVWLQECVRSKNSAARFAAVRAIVDNFKDDPTTPALLQEYAQHDDKRVRREAVEAITKHFNNHPQTLPLLRDRIQNDDFSNVRELSIRAIHNYFGQASDVFELLCDVAQNDPFQRKNDWQNNPRQNALKALLTHYPNHPKTLELLRNRAENDPDEQLREWAQEQLKMQNVKLKMEESSDG